MEPGHKLSDLWADLFSYGSCKYGDRPVRSPETAVNAQPISNGGILPKHEFHHRHARRGSFPVVLRLSQDNDIAAIALLFHKGKWNSVRYSSVLQAKHFLDYDTSLRLIWSTCFNWIRGI